jgi:ferredoxin
MKFLKESDLPAFLEHLSGEAAVVAPAKVDGMVRFLPWSPGTEVELEALLARQSAKEFIFPQWETFLKFRYLMVCDAKRPGTTEDAKMELRLSEEGEGGGEVVAVPAPAAHELLMVGAEQQAVSQVIFGLRPCDARGFVQMDRVFGGYGGFYFDPYYHARRSVATLLVVSCHEPRSTCFCRGVGGGPADAEGADVLFTRVPEGFVAQAFSDKGAAVLQYPGFEEVSEPQVAAAEQSKARAEEMVSVPFELESLREGLRANFESADWQELSRRCISCGTCTYVCPNCYCFNVTDEVVETQGERLRSWDNCFNPSYTLEASGHNPRDAKPSRFRNRFNHKFWYYPEKYDSLLCSGCGRCITYCPTRIDIREVLSVMGGNETRAAGQAAGGAGAADGQVAADAKVGGDAADGEESQHGR